MLLPYILLKLTATSILVFAYEMNKSQKLLLETWVNQIVRFGKPDCPILSGPTAVRGTTGLRRGAPPLVKWHLDREGA
jgi:hypothetical protein